MHDYAKQLIKLYELQSDSMVFHKKVTTSSNVMWIKESLFMIPIYNEEKNTFFLALSDIVADRLIQKIDIMGVLGNDTTGLTRPDYVLSGEFAISPSRKTVCYMTHYAGRAFIIDMETLNVNLLQDFREPDFPKSFLTANEIVLEPDHSAFTSVAMDEEFIYILSPRRLDKPLFNNEFAIDVYDFSGTHIESVSVPRLNNDIPRRISKLTSGFAIAYSNGTIGVFDNR